MTSSSSADTRLAVGIGIATTGARPSLLALTSSLAGAKASPLVEHVEIVLVHNGNCADPCPVRMALQAPESGGPQDTPIRLLHEPQPGVPFARNALVRDLLSRNVDYIVFIDDDQQPSDDWLREIVGAIVGTEADVVAAPVHAVFSEQVPKWVHVPGTFSRRQRPEAALLETCGTGNTIVRRQIFESMPMWFDPAYGCHGGSDVDFFRRVKAAGYRLVWTNRAAVDELVPAYRCRLRWLLRSRFGRSFADTLAWKRRNNAPLRPHAYVKIVLKTLTQILYHSLSFATSMRNPVRKVASVKGIGNGFGRLTGMFAPGDGARFAEYSYRHTSLDGGRLTG